MCYLRAQFIDESYHSDKKGGCQRIIIWSILLFLHKYGLLNSFISPIPHYFLAQS